MKVERRSGRLPPGESAILMAIVQYGHPADGLDKSRLDVLAGYKRSARNTYLGRLKKLGYIDDLGGGYFRATPEGVAALGDYERLPTGARLLAHWRNKLPPGELAILEAAVALYPDAAERDRVGSESGYARSARNTYIGRLIKRGLLEAVDRGVVRAVDDLFDRPVRR